METAAVALMLLIAAPTTAEADGDERAVFEADARFWEAYNSCDVGAAGRYFTEDLEFYHDRGGLTEGRSALVDGMRQGLCKPGGSRLRREAVPGTVRFDPVPGHGAILTGEHLFYVREPGKAEHLDGQARFAHVWQHTDGQWRMRRVLSYDHGPPRAIAALPGTKVLATSLARHAGRYQSPTQGVAEVMVQDGRLRIVAGELALILEPVSETSFKAVGRDLRFDFATDTLSVWENGQKVDEAQRID